MTVKVKVPYFLRYLTNGVAAVDVEGGTVGECVSALVQQFPQLEDKLFNKDGGLLRYIDVFINDESAYPEELAKPVRDGDELSIMNIIAGG